MFWVVAALALIAVMGLNIWKFLRGDIGLGAATGCQVVLLFTLVVVVAKALT